MNFLGSLFSYNIPKFHSGLLNFKALLYYWTSRGKHYHKVLKVHFEN